MKTRWELPYLVGSVAEPEPDSEDLIKLPPDPDPKIWKNRRKSSIFYNFNVLLPI